MTTPRALPADALHDPATIYRELRAEGPLHHVVLPNGMRSWLVVDHELARRALVNRAFTPRAVEAMRGRIEEVATGLLDAVERRVAAGEAEVDLLAAFAYPLPMTVISDLLGIPEEDRGRFRAWSDLIMSATGPENEEIAGAATAMTAYLAGLVAQRREHPGDSMLDRLIAVAEDGDRLSADELVMMGWLLLIAGYETTANLIGNGLVALLRHPDQLALLRADPALLPDAVEELLRFDGPLNLATLRHTTAPWTVGEVTVPAGEFVAVSVLAANADPARWSDPERLDVTRDTTGQAGGHLTFGHGIHFCVGAPLARLEGVIAFRELLARFPDMTLACEPARLAWRSGALSHGLVELPIRPGRGRRRR